MNCIVLLTLCISLAVAREYKPRYQPVDTIRLETYLHNPRLWAIQEKCLLKNGPCDSIGRWVKARLNHAVATGECILCTPKQSQELGKLIEYIIEKKPELYEQGVRNYLAEKGIAAPPKNVLPTPKSVILTPTNS